MQLEPQYTVKWSLLELMSVLSPHELKCMLTSACSSLVNTAHLIILSPAWPSAEEMLNVDGKEYPNKVLAKRLYWKLRTSDAQILSLTIPIQTDRFLLSANMGGWALYHTLRIHPEVSLNKILNTIIAPNSE